MLQGLGSLERYVSERGPVEGIEIPPQDSALLWLITVANAALAKVMSRDNF